MGNVDIDDAIRQRIERQDLMTQMLLTAHGSSKAIQGDFIGKLTGLAKGLRSMLSGSNLIRKINYKPRDFWSEQKGECYCFIDGGVANVDLPTSAPMAIRVGSYVVRPGDETESREEFNIELSLIDELFSDDATTFDDIFDDESKLTDAARMTLEVASGLRVARRVADISAIFLHGPLVNPASPYGVADFPSFTDKTAKLLVDEPEASLAGRDKNFIPVYLSILNKLIESGCPILGIVERSMSRRPKVVEQLLNKLNDLDVLSNKDQAEIMGEILEYRLTDTALLGVILSEGEYVEPVEINRQGPENKWPDYWAPDIRKYPAVLTSYLKTGEESEPFRIEAFTETKGLSELISLIFHTSRLLPNYGFPVGLDIVDKYAKVPNWLSRSVRGQYATILLKQALKTGNYDTISFAKRVLAARGRDWLFRPKS